jgi:alpha-galactosidase
MIGKLSIGVLAMCLVPALAAPVGMTAKRAWVERHFTGAPNAQGPDPVVFSFTYADQPSAKLLPDWKPAVRSRKLDESRAESTWTWTDPSTALEVRLVAAEYSDFPVVEWTVYFRNAGQADTPILADIRGMDLSFARSPHDKPAPREFTLSTIRGDDCSMSSYQPITMKLSAGAGQSFAPAGGRPTNGVFPCWNIEWQNEGLIVAVGWPGQWSARIEHDKSRGLVLRGGQELTKLKLHPGETIRTPLSVLMFWEGDFTSSQNLWRRWMLAHNTPRPGGKMVQLLSSSCMGLQQNEKGEKGFVDAYLAGGVKLDYWWMDAGWYPCDGNWWNVGTWEPDPKRFPNGIRAVADHAHAKGMKLVLWFEPERAHRASWLFEQRPKWLLSDNPNDRLLNLGNPEARQWLTDLIDRYIREQGVDLYRQDHNIDPLGFWRGNDASDRQGMTENLYVQGYLAFWDELLRRHPDLLIDSCASGGRRNDLETLRRAVPLLRSDFQCIGSNRPGMCVGNQAHTYGLSPWIGYYGTGEGYDNLYSFRSHLCPAMGIGHDPAKVDWAVLKKRWEEWKIMAPLFYGDFYPLTGYSLSDEVWMAWQFHRPEQGDGMVQVFRRAESDYESARFRLSGLDAGAMYTFTDLDTGKATRLAGSELANTGLPVRIESRPVAVVLVYRQER